MEKERIRLPFVGWFAYTMAIEFEVEKVKDQNLLHFVPARAQARCETLKIRYKIGSKKKRHAPTCGEKSKQNR